MIDVTPQQLATVQRILAEHVPECEVRAFGSRVTWTAKDYSDLDLAVVGPTKLEAQRLGKLREAFEESDLPFRVDVIDWHAIAATFRKVIEEKNEVVQPKPGILGKGGENSGMSGWATKRLAELCEIFDGPHATPEKTTAGPIFLGISSLVGGRLDLTATEHLSEPDFKKWTKRVTPKAGDLVFSYETRLGEAALIPEGLRCCLGRRMGLLRARPGKVDPKFLLYAYLSPAFQETLRTRTIHGSTVDRIPLNEMGDFQIQIPTAPKHQRAIARTLGTLDDKIELNRRQNETLEAMALALFKSWFVDFDPVRAKAEGGDSKLSGPLSPLFPSRLTGGRPHGWEERGLDGIATYLNGLAMQKFPPDGPNSLPVIKIAQLRQGSTKGADRASIHLDPAYVVQDGDILFSWSGSLEVEIWCGGKGALNQHLFKVIPNKVPEWFAFMWTRHHLTDFRLIAAGKATTMGHIQRHHLTQAKALLPGADLLAEMDKVMTPIFDQIIRNKLESRKLAQTRDLLLPRLLSGELVPGPMEVEAR